MSHINVFVSPKVRELLYFHTDSLLDAALKLCSLHLHVDFLACMPFCLCIHTYILVYNT